MVNDRMKKIYLNGKQLTLRGNQADYYYRSLSRIMGDVVISYSDRFIAKNSVVLDIGANIGLTAVRFAKCCPRGMVYAVEPSPVTFKILQENVAENHLTNVEALNTAISDKCGSVSFYDTKSFAAGSFASFDAQSLAAKHTSGDEIKVESTTLDSLVEKLNLEQLDFVKVDIEGFEYHFLQGAHETLSRFKPNVILEFNSYCLVTHGRVLPDTVLQKIMAIFPYVYLLTTFGELRRIFTESDGHTFIHDQFTKKKGLCNLLCSFTEVPMLSSAERRSLISSKIAQKSLQVLESVYPLQK